MTFKESKMLNALKEIKEQVHELEAMLLQDLEFNAENLREVARFSHSRAIIWYRDQRPELSLNEAKQYIDTLCGR